MKGFFTTIIKQLKSLKIKGNTKTVAIMTGFIIFFMIMLPLVFLNEESIISTFNMDPSNIVKKSSINFSGDEKVKLYRTETGKVEEIDIEEYIKGVICAEMPANFEEEALKAQAVAARTYYINKKENKCREAEKYGADICDSTHCQAYLDKETKMKAWSKKDAEANWEKISSAVDDTKGQVLTYDGKILEYPQFFAVSSGKTEDAVDVFAADVPYLKSTESTDEESAPKYETTKKISKKEFVNAVKSKYKNCGLTEKNIQDEVKILSRTEGDGIKEIKLGSETISGIEFRTLMGLNSTNAEIKYEGTDVIFDCKGYGHRVGMSQWGADAMAKKGKDYKEILHHYYTGVDIEQLDY